MKRIVLLLALFVFGVNLMASSPKFSFNTRIFMSKKMPAEFNRYYTQDRNGVVYTKVYLAVDSNYSLSALKQLGARELVKTKSVSLVSVPIERLEELAKLDFISKIEVATKTRAMLDTALRIANVDKVHSGIDLRRSYYGKGVIVGVVDIGFDFTHPMFWDSNGRTRVKRAWLTEDSSGIPPAGNELGTLFTDADYLQDVIKYTATDELHGTHVMGIAAGREVVGRKSVYSGVASEADIAVVDRVIETTDLPYGLTEIEAFAYLFSYADSLGKPIVINLSSGERTNLHACDGKMLKELALSELINEKPEGHIVVVAAGNDADIKHHLQYKFGDNDSLKFGLYKGWISLLYSENAESTIKMQFDNSQIECSLPSITLKPGAKVAIDTIIQVPDGTLYLLAYTSDNYTDVSRPFLNIFASGSPEKGTVHFTLYSSKSELHCWNLGGGAYNYLQSGVTTDNAYSVASPGTVEEVITVGSYNTSKYPPKDTISHFSSKGPTIDGRIKPDIAAPGNVMTSAYNNGFVNNGPKEDTTLDGKYYFITAGGTSMSAPMVAGIVALMLEINPKLTQTEVKDILRITAMNDGFTGNARENKSTTWGWGKIDAYAIIERLEEVGITEEQGMEFSIYPNPATTNMTLTAPESELPYIVNIYDMMGKLVYLSALHSSKSFDISGLGRGIYFVKIDNGKESSVRKLVVEN
ncbi:MAG: S8 family peptidase [Ignavibacteria bacterium]|jgi:subtilisin family serine protease|nr:S8 family peptidase [Ignavibacteria bacterium]